MKFSDFAYKNAIFSQIGRVQMLSSAENTIIIELVFTIIYIENIALFMPSFTIFMSLFLLTPKIVLSLDKRILNSFPNLVFEFQFDL